MKIFAMIIMCAVMVSLVSSSRSCRRACNGHWSPFCGTDGVTYRNKCVLNNAKCEAGTGCLLAAYQGRCVEDVAEQTTCPPRCPRVEQPWCAHDGNTYKNLCELQKAGIKKPNERIIPRRRGPCAIGSPLLTADD